MEASDGIMDELEIEDFRDTGTGGYFDALGAYFQEALKPDLPEFPTDLSLQIVTYLLRASETPQSVPMELIDGVLSYLGDATQETEDYPPFAEIEADFRTRVLPAFASVDVIKLDKDGVAGFAHYFPLGGFDDLFKSLFEFFKVMKRLKDLERPGNFPADKPFRRTGPFKLLATDEFVFFASLPYRFVHPSAKRAVQTSLTKKYDAPKTAVMTTGTLTSYTAMLTNKRAVLRNTPGPATISSVATDRVGPISVMLDTEFTRLVSKEVTHTFRAVDHQYSTNDLSGKFVTLLCDVRAEHWAFE